VCGREGGCKDETRKAQEGKRRRGKQIKKYGKTVKKYGGGKPLLQICEV
jgi:hypothetical protein